MQAHEGGDGGCYLCIPAKIEIYSVILACFFSFLPEREKFQMWGLTGLTLSVLLLLPWASPQKLGAGTGSGSCRAFPYRVENVSGQSFALMTQIFEKSFVILGRLTGKCAPLRFPAAMNMVIVEQRCLCLCSYTSARLHRCPLTCPRSEKHK